MPNVAERAEDAGGLTAVVVSFAAAPVRRFTAGGKRYEVAASLHSGRRCGLGIVAPLDVVGNVDQSHLGTQGGPGDRRDPRCAE